MFSDEKRRYYTEKYGFTYQMKFVSNLAQLVSLEDARVIDIGGSNMPRELVFDELKAKQWVSVDYCDIGSRDGSSEESHYRNEPILTVNGSSDPDRMPDYCLVNGMVEDLPDSFHGKFDVAVSIAAFEHVVHLPRVLDKIYDLLVPGGILVSLFSPIWSSCWGHHTWPFERGGKTYDEGSQHIPEWGHLLMTPAEMFDHLSRHTSRENADNVVYQVYHSEKLNRYFVEDYETVLRTSRFSQKYLVTSAERQIDEETRETLMRRYPGRTDFSAQSLIIRAVK